MTLLSTTTLTKFRFFRVKILATSLTLCLTLGFLSITTAPAAVASVSDWQKGVSLYPEANNDFSSQTFRQSLANAAAMHANMATFIVPYYQLTDGTTDIQIGWNTPTDASLIDGIEYAHSLGMGTTIKIHLSPYYGDSWAAYINPPDRTGWFSAYGTILAHYAALAQAHGVEQICIGNELTDMTTYTASSTNTAEWEKLIANTRLVYGGLLTYNANGGGFHDEKDDIAFWPELDAVGVSAYVELGDDRNASWQQWNQDEIVPLEQKFSKPILFTEIGYRSVDGARSQPWNYTLSGAPNMQEQVDNYTSLFNYWNDYSYMQGINIWNWDTNPNAGGTNNTDYTMQNKPAQTTVSDWFSGKLGNK